MLKLPVSAQLQSKLPLLIALLPFGNECDHVAGAGWLHPAVNYISLNWNLFLAWIPLIFALAAWLLIQRRTWMPVILLLLAGWLLFLPNAAYIITDLIHLRARNGAPLWYDALGWSFPTPGMG